MHRLSSFVVIMHQKSQEDEPLTNGEQWSESRTRTANAQLTAGDVNSPRNGEPNREFDAVDHHIITVSQASMDYICCLSMH